MSSPTSEPQAAYYPIRVVSNETGVNAITLRAWERRYGLITPKRTAKGHRLYTESDIQLIRKVVSLLERGVPVSQAKAMIDSGDPEPETILISQPQPSQWHQYRASLAKGVQQFDAAQLSTVADEVSQFFPIDIALRFLLIPMYQHLRDQVTQPLGQARMQFYGGFLQGRLAGRLGEESNLEYKGTLVVANTTQDDDLDMLLLAILLKQLGLRIVRLAGLTATDDITELLRHQQWQGAVLRIPKHASDTQKQQLQRMVLESGAAIFVIGQQADEQTTLRQKGLVTLNGDLQQDAINVRDMLLGLPE